MPVFHKHMHYSEKKKLPQSLIRLRSNDLNACKPSQHDGCNGSEFAAPPVFRHCRFFCESGFSPFFFPQVPLGLICIISPKSAARYDGITLHDGWIWAKAAVRTGYLANVLSRPCLGTREEERQREWVEEKREGVEKGREKDNLETQ